MVVTGYDERSGCGYVLRTGADIGTDAGTDPGGRIEHHGTQVAATAELATLLRDALQRRSLVPTRWGGPEIPLSLDDPTMLAWLRYSVGGVLTVSGGPDQQ